MTTTDTIEPEPSVRPKHAGPVPVRSSPPAMWLSVLILVLATAFMAWLRLYLYPQRFVTLTYGLPLLICLWHRDRVLLWSMAAAFTAMSAYKFLWLMPDPDPADFTELTQWIMQVVNILVIGGTVHLVIVLQQMLTERNVELSSANERLQAQNAEIERQNEELQAQSEELARQNEELQQQSEEIQQQSEETQRQAQELESQSDELRAQTEELQQSNVELTARESFLQFLLGSLPTIHDESALLALASSRILQMFGENASAGAVAIVQQPGAEGIWHFAGAGVPARHRAPLQASLCSVVMTHDKTAFVDDLEARPDLRLAIPTKGGAALRSALATPIKVGAEALGTVEVYSNHARQWSTAEFRLIEWVAAQCALFLQIVRLQEAVRASGERLNWVLHATGVGLWMNPMPLKQLHWDRRTRELFFVEEGVEPEVELFWDRVHPDDREPTRLAVEAAVRDGNRYSIEHRVVHPKTGEVRWIHSAGQCTYAADGTPVRFDGINYDITDRRAFQAELEKLVGERTQSLQETTRQFNEFCYAIAHDLKAPIRAQAAFAHTLVEDFGDVLGEVGRAYAKRIEDAAQRQGRLVTDLLTHVSLSRTDMAMTQVELADVLKLVHKDLELEVRNRQANVSLGGVGGAVKANPASLHLVLSHLISNALKFVPQGTRPEIKVRSEQNNGLMRLWVEDNGIGIPRQYHEKLFGVFQRLHSQEQYPGTGIGLALVKRAVERMGGRVGFESEPGQGSRFWLELKTADASS